MSKKIVVGGLSAILLVVAIVGVVAGVMRSNHKAGNDVQMPDTPDGALVTSTKSVKAICATTDYQAACEETLGSAVNSSANAKEVIQTAIRATIDQVKAAFDKAGGFDKFAADPMNKAALNDCKTLLQDAVEELEAAFHEAGGFEGLANRADDLLNWLSAVVSYQETCIDGLTHPELKDQMQTGLVNATQLTSNALAIVTMLSTMVKDLPFQMNKRRLLSDDEVYERDAEGFPRWLSAGDRKLMAARGNARVRPNVVVAKDGSGNYKSIMDALNKMPKSYRGRYVIYVKAGVYNEHVIVDKDKANVFMYGDGPRKTIVTGSKNFIDGTPTFETATFAVLGQGFIAKSMGFSNTAGPAKHQAVALRVQADMSAFFNCRMDAFQDTLYVQTHRQFYRNCVISGTVDFIFGDASSILQNCLLIVRRPMDNQQCIVTAQGRKEKRETTGIVIHNCRIVPDKALFPDRFKIRSYLGRPWKEYSRTVIMESTIGDLIRPEGFMPWEGNFALNTLYYAEYGNRGPGANTRARVNWKGYHRIGRQEAMQFTAARFINGGMWLKYTGAPFLLGLRH